LAGRKNLLAGAFLVFLAFMMLSSLWIIAPNLIQWNSAFPCCFIFETGVYNIIFGLLAEKSPAPGPWKEVASFLALATILLPAGLFVLHFLRWTFAIYFVTAGIWGGLTSAALFLVWPPRLSG